MIRHTNKRGRNLPQKLSKKLKTQMKHLMEAKWKIHLPNMTWRT